MMSYFRTNMMTMKTPVALLLLSLAFSSAQDPGVVAGAGGDGDVSACPQSLRDGARAYNAIVGRFGSKCYTIQTTNKMSWPHALAGCTSVAGSLVHIRNDAEQAFVAGFVARHSAGDSVWLGLHDTIIEGSWMWSNGGGLTYSHFAANHLNPTNQDVEDCVVMTPTGDWDDIRCGYNDVFAGMADRGEVHSVMCEFDYGGLIGVIGK